MSQNKKENSPSPSNTHIQRIPMTSSYEDPQPVGFSAQQWTFPANDTAIYSSNSDDNEDVDQERPVSSPQPTHSQSVSCHDQEKVMLKAHDGEWSLRLGRPSTSPAISDRSAIIPNRTIGKASRIQVTADVRCDEESPATAFETVVPAKDTEPMTQRKSSFHSTSPGPRELFLSRKNASREIDYESDEDTDELLEKQYRSDKPVDIPELEAEAQFQSEKKLYGREVAVHHPDFPDRLIEGLLYSSCYLGSTQLTCDGRVSKINRLRQAQEAVNRIKAPNGESQPNVPVELFVSTERILVLNKDMNEIVMDYNLRYVSYIADIGNILVIMTRRRSPIRTPIMNGDNSSPELNPNGGLPTCDSQSHEPIPETNLSPSSSSTTSSQLDKIVCHLFESDEAQLISQAIGRAFHEAYFEFLRAHGIEDPAAFQERDYQTVLDEQDIFRNELQFFSDKEKEKEVIIPKLRGEPLGVVIVESGWGSVLPTAVIANMLPNGAAARCGQLNIGNQIISVNGQSFVGLPLTNCQSFIKSTKNQTAVKMIVVNCPPVVEVLIRRPDTKYQLGFSVQDGVICSLLRGGIAERGGIRVDHQIIEINGESVVAVPHEQIVHLLATSVGEIDIRTMPTSIFRLLTGQDVPHYI